MEFHHENIDTLIDNSVEAFCQVSIENTKTEINKLKELLNSSKDKKSLLKAIEEKEEHIAMCIKELNFIGSGYSLKESNQ